MPISPPRLCHRHKKPFTGTHCPLCEEEWKQKNRNNDNRESSSKRGYDRHWSKTRGVKLSNDPFCERCLANGKDVPAQMVHHKDRNVWNRAFDNLESMCKDCHNDEHKEDVFGKRNLSVSGLDIGKISIRVVLVCGPPGAGKTTYALSKMQPQDEIIDLDMIRSELTGKPIYYASNKSILRGIIERNNRIVNLKHKYTGTAYIVAQYPSYKEREAVAKKLKAEVVVLETSPEECKKRIMRDNRRPDRIKAEQCDKVDLWWRRYVKGQNRGNGNRRGELSNEIYI